jgi:hypothetical protein
MGSSVPNHGWALQKADIMNPLGRLRRLVAATITAVVVGGGLVVGIAAPAQAADPAAFDPGYIISDARFFDRNAMDEASIQQFLRSKLPTCAQANGSACLPNYTESTVSRAATSRCAAYEGAPNEPASRIIDRVAKACGINPQVLIVTLQKENGLVTNGSPRAGSYKTAMGYGCPDTAACDAQYFGFFNQVYSAASQFIRYGVNPSNWTYRIGQVAIQYKPFTSCGAPVVNIRNQATANLYNYTPYQPNAAAMAAGYGTGDGCSSYGNRNFWLYFTDWFGSTTGPIDPIGWVDTIAAAPGGVRVAGWAIDPDTAAPIEMHVYVDGQGAAALTASAPRPDIAAAFVYHGAAHGLDAVVPVGGGQHNVCVYAINVGPGKHTLLQCSTVNVRSGPAEGWLDSVVPGEETVTVSGWGLNPDTAAPTTVHLYVDNVNTIVTADVARADIAAAYPGYGPAHGFVATIPAPAGAHNVCAYVIKDATSATSLGCRQVTVSEPIAERGRVPMGYLDAVTTSISGITARGWTIDPDTTAPIPVELYVDSVPAAGRKVSDRSRPDVAAAFPRYGADHGYIWSQPASPGVHDVCVYAINTAPGVNPRLGCRTVTVPTAVTHVEQGRTPIGWVDSVTATSTGYSVDGWTLDPDTAAPISVDIYVDGGYAGSATANGSRPDVGAAFQLWGDAHGFTTTVPAPPGMHNVCVYAINTSGSNPPLACSTVAR